MATGPMKVKGKRIINSEEAAEFANTVRGQYIISQALVMSVKTLKKYEDDEDAINSEPSNRKDMEYLLKAFPLYQIHEYDTWKGETDNG